MCILKGFSQLIVSFDEQDGFLCESLSFENYMYGEFQGKLFHSLIFQPVNFIVRWNLLASLINSVGTCVFFALYFSSNKVHLTAIIQGTWRNILFFTNYTQIIIIVVNYQDYNYLIL